jgi:hypothetical protein
MADTIRIWRIYARADGKSAMEPIDESRSS